MAQTRTLLVPAIAAAIFASVAAPAAAGEVIVSVSAEGLDLTSSADIATMKDRIDGAVKKACSRPTAAARFGGEAIDECVADGTAKALAALDAQLARD